MSTKETRARVIPHNPAAKTRQEPKASTDINRIVANARKGIAPQWINRRQPIYTDMTQVPKDLLSAYQRIEAAEAAFDALPSEIRHSLDHNPMNLPQWLQNPANRPLAEKYGLIKEAPTPPSPASPTARGEPQGGELPGAPGSAPRSKSPR